MSRILVLGGTGDGRALAQALVAAGHDLLYSVAGLTVPSPQPFATRAGGFGGVDGLHRLLGAERMSLLIDATHPYAERMSQQARVACARAGIPLWALRRPPWSPVAGDDWREIGDLHALWDALRPFRRPFFSIGREPLLQSDPVPAGQHWFCRCLAPAEGRPGMTVIRSRGPFTVDGELRLLNGYRIDVLVSKNSGGAAVAAKLTAARKLGLPVLMLARPAPVPADREFDRAADLLKALTG